MSIALISEKPLRKSKVPDLGLARQELARARGEAGAEAERAAAEDHVIGRIAEIVFSADAHGAAVQVIGPPVAVRAGQDEQARVGLREGDDAVGAVAVDAVGTGVVDDARCNGQRATAVDRDIQCAVRGPARGEPAEAGDGRRGEHMPPPKTR